LGKRGDCLERVKIRLDEISESIKIINQCLENTGDEKGSEVKSVPDGETYSRVEAPRGELFYFIKTKNNLIERTKIRTPTLAYIQYLDEMLVGNEVKDVPLIIASLDPCFSCLERVMIAKEGITKSLNEKDFRDAYCK
jgi:Ni,Fe-hydrogenase III large subunit